MKIALIGLGRMGTAIVERLLKQGYEVTVYNRTAAKMQPLLTLGAHGASSLAEAIQHADIVLSCLLDDEALSTVTTEMLKSLASHAIHVSLSTVLPETAKQMETMHLRHGSYYVSVALLGIPKVAREGDLTLFCAGQQAAVDRVMPVLNAISGNIIPLGHPIHLPNVFKICMNYAAATALQLISELYVFAEKSGLQTDYVKTALHHIYGHPAFGHYIDKIHEKNFDEVNFDMRGGNKDVSIFQHAFADVGMTANLAKVIQSSFSTALAEGKQDKDWSAIYEVIRAQSSLV